MSTFHQHILNKFLIKALLMILSQDGGMRVLVAGGWSGHNIRTAEVKKGHSQRFPELQEVAKLFVSKGFSKVLKVSKVPKVSLQELAKLRCSTLQLKGGGWWGI